MHGRARCPHQLYQLHTYEATAISGTLCPFGHPLLQHITYTSNFSKRFSSVILYCIKNINDISNLDWSSITQIITAYYTPSK